MTEQNYCVVWNREANLLEMCPLDTLLQLNNASFLDDKPPRALLRTGMEEMHARRFIKGYAALMARRSLARLDAVERLEAEEKAGAA